MNDSTHRIAFLGLVVTSLACSSPAFGFSFPSSLENIPVLKAPGEAPEHGVPKIPVTIPDQLMPEIVDQVGIWMFRQVTGRRTESDSKSDKELVNRVCKRIVEQAKQGRYGAVARSLKWETKLVVGDDINAIAFPGGKVLVYTGLLDFTNRNEDQLAVVIGHEVVHAVARHVADRVSKELRQEIMLAYTGKKLADDGLSPAAAAGVMVAMGVAREGTVLQPFARAQESEADHEGLLLAAGAGFDPQVAPGFWQGRKQYETASMVPALLASHPTTDVRIQQLKGWLPEAMALHRQAAAPQVDPIVTADNDRGSRRAR